MTMTFKDFLIEVTTDTAALDDPELKRDLMRRMRAADSDQAEKMDTRFQRDQQRAQRKDMQSETDPRRKTLKRKKLTLQRQIDAINAELSDTGEGDME